MAQLLDTFVGHIVVSFILKYSIFKTIARVVYLGEAYCFNTLLKDVNNTLAKECYGLKPKKRSLQWVQVLYKKPSQYNYWYIYSLITVRIIYTLSYSVLVLLCFKYRIVYSSPSAKKLFNFVRLFFANVAFFISATM